MWCLLHSCFYIITFHFYTSFPIEHQPIINRLRRVLTLHVKFS
ncbi:hypothetical protein DXB54_08170 [Coprococcus sp. OM04-5BH]|nr:hypothetical protein DXB54_08170 [Coprococcus sp. OM04-5BH]